MILFSYWRSTTSLRVRAALNLKAVAYTYRPVDLLSGGHRSAEFLSLNPSGGVPVLVLDDGTVLRQSMAILEWLEEVYPEPALLPFDALDKARVRAAAQIVAMDIHPVNNMKIGSLLRSMGHDQEDVVQWMCHWMDEGFAAFQALIPSEGRYCFGDNLTLADLCLVGQMVNARRWGLDLAPYSRLVEIDKAARAVPEIASAMPENQPDAT